jgi:arabinose-5-phosphate isomerase
MLKKLFEEQRQHLDLFFERIDVQRAEEIFRICLESKGLLIFTGIGKSGIIAEKIAMTLVSTGTKALYLPSVNFLHGDIGIVSKEDIVFLLSKSGETEELLNLVPFLRRRGARLVGVVSNEESRLAKTCDVSISLPVEKELCPFNLAPTTSTVVQLLFGDALAVALMQAKEFNLSDYAKTHPSGSLGKKMTLLVEDIMIKGEEVPLCFPEDSLQQVLVELSNKRCGCLLIADREKSLLGIFTDGDLRRALQIQGPHVLEKRMESLMTPSATVVEKTLLAWEAIQIMQRDPKKWIMVCPVVEAQKIVGIIRMHDIIHSGIA